jgi:hypothetical protein
MGVLNVDQHYIDHQCDRHRKNCIILHQSESTCRLAAFQSASASTDNPDNSKWGVFFFEFRPALGIINDPKLTQTEGSEDKHSCAAGVEAELLSLPLTMQ